MTEPSAILCPYCGKKQAIARRCSGCGGHFDRWSLAATQNEMGPWFIRDESNPHFVGLGYEAVVAMIQSHELDRDTPVRGPTTGQYWMLARRVPGLAHHFGRCHGCQSPVDPASPQCRECGVLPPVQVSRNQFGLPPIAPVDKPSDARPDFSAFVEDGRLLVAAPSIPLAPAGAASPTSERPSPAPHAAGMVHVDGAIGQHRAAVLDRALVGRVRSLERVNRWLLAIAIMGFASALLFVVAYLRELDQRDRAVSEAKAAVRKEIAGDTKRGAPVAPASKPELPPLPELPPR